MLVSRLTIYNAAHDKKRIRRVVKRNQLFEKPHDSDTVHRLREQVAKYKRDQAKLKRLAEWNLRSTRSSLKDVEETLQILRDLYGEEAFDDTDEY